MVNRAIIQHLLNNLEGYLNDLRSATHITHRKYLADVRLQRFVERTLQIAIECCFDVVHHIISDEGFREPSSYADAFTVLTEQTILPAESRRDYQLMAQFRNKIVHYYDKIDPEQVYAIFRKKLQPFYEFRNGIERWLNSRCS